MAYRLEEHEEIGAGVLRIGRGELDAALGQLRQGIDDDEVRAIHEARKGLKKERALLRLVRGCVPREIRQAEIRRLRDAGRRLSSLRDAQVALQTVDDLSERYAGQLPKAAFARVRRAVREHGAADGAAPGAGLRATASAVADELEDARAAVESWAGRAERWKDLEGGLARAYAGGRDALGAVEERRDDERLHEWRKRVKDLWYHQRLLHPLWPEVTEAQAEVLDELGQLLGDDQDLANLRATLGSLAAAGAAPPMDVERLSELIDGRRDELQARALGIGRRVYAEAPKAFVRRHRAYARAWEGERQGSAVGAPRRFGNSKVSPSQALG